MKSFEMIIHYDRIGDSDMYNCHEVGELVRCKDCKHKGKIECRFGITVCDAPQLNDYCSYGEKKDG